jgi:WD40 repeat protein
VAFSPDGARLASCGLGGHLKVWDTKGGGLEYHFAGGGEHGTAHAIAWHPDGTKLAIAADGKTAMSPDPFYVHLRELHSGAVRTFYGHAYSVRSVAFSPDGTRILSASEHGTVRLWHVATGLELMMFRQGADGTPVAFTADGRYITFGSKANTLSLIDSGPGIVRAGLTRAGGRAHAPSTLDVLLEYRSSLVMGGLLLLLAAVVWRSMKKGRRHG